MTTRTISKPKMSAKNVGLGLALAAGAVGAYMLYGSSEGENRRKRIKGWMLKVKGDVLAELENIKEVNKETYEAVVDKVIKRYEGVKGIRMGELLALGTSLKSSWSKMIKTKKPPRNKAKRTKKESGV